MLDLFGVVNNLTDETNIIDYIKNIIDCPIISLFTVDWVKYYHLFYIKNISITECDEYIRIKILENKSISIIDFNNKFIIIDKLNSSYNHKNGIDKYTLMELQKIYISTILYNKDLLNIWIEFIINIDITDKNDLIIINLFDNYLQIITNYMFKDEFVKLYGNYIIEYIINKYDNDKISLLEICNFIIKINKTNLLFLQTKDLDYLKQLFIHNIIPYLDIYLNKMFKTNMPIDINIIETYHIINIEKTDYNNIVSNFLETWKTKQKEQLSNKSIVENFINIHPIINNKIECIVEYYNNIFNTSDLFDYLLKLFNKSILYLYNDKESNIDTFIIFLSLYRDKNILLEKYYDLLVSRVFKYCNSNIITQNIITIELTIFDKLQKYIDCDSKKIILYFTNLKQNLIDTLNIHKCKFNLITNNNTPIVWNDFDITKVNLNLFANYNHKEITFLNYDIISPDIKNYIKICSTYQTKIHELYKINWDIENSVVDININKMNIICTIIQYVLIFTINNNKYTVDELINYIINKEKTTEQINGLKSYIHQLFELKIISINENILSITSNDNSFDISEFIPCYNTNIEIKEIQLCDKILLNNLRCLLLSKMFKHNSTTHFTLDTIMDTYKQYNNAKSYIQNITIQELKYYLNYLAERYIIEQTKNNEYIYLI